MDKRQFLEQVIERVRALNVADIIERYIELPKKNPSSYFGLCPFHNDTRLGSFVVTPQKGIFKCFACQTGGDATKFVSLFTGVSYVEAAFDIARDENLITSEEYDNFFTKRRYTKKETHQIEKISIAKTNEKNKNNIGDVILLDAVFNVLLDTASLKAKHREYLNNERQLSNKVIEKRKYKSAQGATDVFMGKFIGNLNKNKTLKELIQNKEQYSQCEKIEDVLEFVPGFFQKKKKNNWIWDFAYNQGIFIPIRNPENQIVGLQVRRDKKDEDRGRYFWFSSSFASYNDNFQKGTSSGSPMDVLYPKESPSKALFITEGRFKSEAVIDKIGAISLSIQGVSTWKNINQTIKEIEDEAKKRYKDFDKFENICIAFDSDMSYKIQVYQQLKKMSDVIAGKYREKGMFYIHWTDGYKGIDDLLINSGCQNKHDCYKLFNTHTKSYFDKEFYKQLQELLDKKKKTNPFDLTQDDLVKGIDIKKEKKIDKKAS